MLERWRRLPLPLLIGLLFGLMVRQSPAFSWLLVGLSGYLAATEGLAAWLFEARSGRLGYYQAWGLGRGAVVLGLSLAAALPGLLALSLAFALGGLPLRPGPHIALAGVAAVGGLAVAAAGWRFARQLPWLENAFLIGWTLLAGWLGRLLLG